MKLTESLTLNQQQQIIDGVLELACRAGVIKARSPIVNGQQLLMLLDEMGEFLTMERPVKEVVDGVITNSCAFIISEEVNPGNGKPKEIRTSRVITPPGEQFVTQFETLNTVYRAQEGKKFEDLRVQPPEEPEE